MGSAILSLIGLAMLLISSLSYASDNLCAKLPRSLSSLEQLVDIATERFTQWGRKKHYVSLFSRLREGPLCVVYPLNKTSLQVEKKHHNCHWTRKRSPWKVPKGFNRGHLFPRAHAPDDPQDTFDSLLNRVPQEVVGNLEWSRLEKEERDMAMQNDIVGVTGVVYPKNPSNKVPWLIYKIILNPANGCYFAFSLLNWSRQHIQTTTLEYIEEKSGLHFFSQVPRESLKDCAKKSAK